MSKPRIEDTLRKVVKTWLVDTILLEESRVFPQWGKKSPDGTREEGTRELYSEEVTINDKEIDMLIDSIIKVITGEAT